MRWISGRNAMASAPTPRMVTFAPLSLLFFGISTTTTASADAIGLPAESLRMPGASMTVSVDSRDRVLASSESEPPRSTIARSSRPVARMVRWKPVAMASTGLSTAQTEALRNAAEVHPGDGADLCEHAHEPDLSTPGERVDDVEPRRTPGRRQAGKEREQHRHTYSQGDDVYRQMRLTDDALQRRENAGRDGEAEERCHQAQNERLGEYQHDDRKIGKAESLQHCKLRHAFAHRLHHGVARQKEQREENRAQDRSHDEADISLLLDERLRKFLFRLSLRLIRRVGEALVDRGCDLHRLLRILHLHHVPADGTPGKAARFVEIAVVEEKADRLVGIAWRVIDADDVECPVR